MHWTCALAEIETKMLCLNPGPTVFMSICCCSNWCNCKGSNPSCCYEFWDVLSHLLINFWNGHDAAPGHDPSLLYPLQYLQIDAMLEGVEWKPCSVLYNTLLCSQLGQCASEALRKRCPKWTVWIGINIQLFIPVLLRKKLRRSTNRFIKKYEPYLINANKDVLNVLEWFSLVSSLPRFLSQSFLSSLQSLGNPYPCSWYHFIILILS